MKSRRTISDRRRATQRKVVRPNGRQPERESARRRSRTLHLASDVTDEPNRNSKPERSGDRRDRARRMFPWGENLTAVRVVAGGESFLAPSITRRLIAAYVARLERARRPRRFPGSTS